jgi:hypothetical protein
MLNFRCGAEVASQNESTANTNKRGRGGNEEQPRTLQEMLVKLF